MVFISIIAHLAICVAELLAVFLKIALVIPHGNELYLTTMLLIFESKCHSSITWYSVYVCSGARMHSKAEDSSQRLT